MKFKMICALVLLSAITSAVLGGCDITNGVSGIGNTMRAIIRTTDGEIVRTDVLNLQMGNGEWIITTPDGTVYYVAPVNCTIIKGDGE